MMTATPLPEPTLAEVIRGQERIELAVQSLRDEVAGTYMRADVHGKTHDALGARIGAVETKISTIESAAADHARFRRYVLPLQMVTWALSAAALVVAILLR